MLGLLPLAAAALLAVAPPPTPAKRHAALAQRGLARAVADGALTRDDAARYRGDLRAALALLGRVPPLRARNLAGVLGDVAARWRSYSSPRALAAFSMLEENTRYLAAHRLPEPGTDVTGEDGVLYRFFPGHGFVFHPLGKSDAEGLGMADLPLVVVPHPVGGMKREQVRQKADAIVDQVVDALVKVPAQARAS